MNKYYKRDIIMVTLELLQALCPKTKNAVLETYIEPLNSVAVYYEMTVEYERLAGFLARIAQE